jgi:hypothetical protein
LLMSLIAISLKVPLVNNKLYSFWAARIKPSL